jgi:glycosyltransferase involved in cell wall biosynthesis
VTQPLVVFNGLNVRPGVDDGAATVTVNLLGHLPDALPEARFLALLQEGEERVPAHERLEILRRPPSGPLRRVAYETLLLSHELRDRGARALVAPFESIPLLVPCPVVVIAQNLLYHADLSSSVLHGLTRRERVLTRARAAYYRRRMPRTYAKAARVIAVSQAVADTLQARAGLDPSRTRVVHEGSDSMLLPEPAGAAEREHALLVVSTLAPYKNLEPTLEVYDRLRRDDPGLELWLAGADWRGYGREVARMVRERGLSGRVQLLGAVDSAALVGLYRRAAALLLLSECESFGLPVLEAMLHGLPVVVADRAALPEVAGGAGIVVDPGDLTATTAAVRLLLDDAEQREKHVEAGRARAAELTWRRSADGVAGVLREVLPGLR